MYRLLFYFVLSCFSEYVISVTESPGINMLGIVVASIFFGVIVGRLEEKGQPLLDFFSSVYEASMMLVKLVIWSVLFKNMVIWSVLL